MAVYKMSDLRDLVEEVYGRSFEVGSIPGVVWRVLEKDPLFVEHGRKAVDAADEGKRNQALLKLAYFARGAVMLRAAPPRTFKKRSARERCERGRIARI